MVQSSSEYRVTGAGGAQLHVAELGDPAGPPILLLHGYAQTHQCWKRQLKADDLAGLRLVAVDLRGHGQSDKPADDRAYADGEAWAEDIAAVIAGADLTQPVVAAWSFAGLILCDYLRQHGDTELAGINLVSARTMVGTDRARGMSGKLFLELAPGFRDSDPVARDAAVRRFLDNLTASEIDPADYQEMLAYNLATPPHVCGALLNRSMENDDVLGALSVPALVTHGDADSSVLLAMAEHHAALIPDAALSVFKGVGHAPFYEDPARFNRELAAFAHRCQG